MNSGVGATAPTCKDEDMTEALERRVSAIEQRQQVIEVRQEVIQGQQQLEAALRAATDRDLSDLTQSVRAQHLLVQALSITQSQHTTALRRIEDTQQAQGEAIETLRRDHGAKLNQIVTLLTGLIERETHGE